MNPGDHNHHSLGGGGGQEILTTDLRGCKGNGQGQYFVVSCFEVLSTAKW